MTRALRIHGPVLLLAHSVGFYLGTALALARAEGWMS